MVMLPRTYGWVARRVVPCALAAGTVLGAAACTGSDTTVGPTTPTTATITDSFSDTLSLNAAKTFPFVVQAAGSVTALVQSISPDATQIIGVALGTWNGETCQLVLSNDAAVQGSTVIGQASTPGNFCLRVYDATGALPKNEAYVVTVTHP
jgi:hypothetical protein